MLVLLVGLTRVPRAADGVQVYACMLTTCPLAEDHVSLRGVAVVAVAVMAVLVLLVCLPPPTVVSRAAEGM
jgi:hypothetical protein